MTMHLEGPWLSTTGKKKGPRRWASSEAKKLAQQRQAEWDRKLVQFDKMAPKFSTGPYNAPRKTMQDFMPKTPLSRMLQESVPPRLSPLSTTAAPLPCRADGKASSSPAKPARTRSPLYQ